MSALLFKNARLIDPEAGTDRLGTLAVRDGKIAGPTGMDDASVIDCEGKCLAPGIVDIGVKVSEPGERHKESFRSAGLAAAAALGAAAVTGANRWMGSEARAAIPRQSSSELIVTQMWWMAPGPSSSARVLVSPAFT